MAIIKVMPSNLKDLGNSLKTLSDNYKETVSEINKTVKEINSLLLWDGTDEENYMQKMDDRYFKTLDKIGVELTDYSDFLIKTSNGYANIEEYFNKKEVEI